MEPDKLKELILAGESSRIEFKRKFTTPEKIAKEISAFANTVGGYLIFGVEDDGKITGVESEKGEIDLIENACKFYLEPPVVPQIYIVDMNGKDVVVIYINKSSIRPHCVLSNPDDRKPDRTAYIRVGEESVAASSEMTRVLSAQNTENPLKLIIGDKEKRLFAYLQNHQKVTVMDFANLVNISRRRAERLLVRLVRASVLQIHQDSNSDYFTLTGN
ncbi:MAG: ATP-binding protein [Bacteroidetes bacterium]|nr:MAG: ATP-binding protein [Bacteroidota bacterium]